MALKPVNFKIEEAELNLLEREAKRVPRRTLSGYLREIVKARERPGKKRLPEPMPSPNN